MMSDLILTNYLDYVEAETYDENVAASYEDLKTRYHRPTNKLSNSTRAIKAESNFVDCFSN
jgi:hypothetical protein